MKEAINTIHRYIGLFAGCFLMINGITGAMIAFKPQLLAAYGPEAQRVLPQDERAPLGTVLAEAKKVITHPVLAPAYIMVSSDPTYPVKMEFAISPGAAPRPPAAPTPGAPRPRPLQAGMLEAPNPIIMLNPYTAEALPRETAVSRFVDSVLKVHRGMWAGTGRIGEIWRLCLSYSVLTLFVLIGTGLYQRWPRGRAAGKWQSWFKINFRLKGTPFYWNLHAVVGTCVLIPLLLTAHTGLMNSRLPEWYDGMFTSFRQSLNIPGLPHPDKPSRMDPTFLTPVWQAFERDVPDYRFARIELPAQEGGPVTIRSGTRQLNYDSLTAKLIDTVVIPNEDYKAFRLHIGGGEANLYQPFFEALLNGNVYMHTGQRWGLIGQIVMLLSALSMPVLFVTGGVLYLRRRRTRSRRVAT